MKRSMRFWKEREKIRLNGFGKLDSFLGNGIVKCHWSQSSLTGTGTAEESDRHMPRPITPYRGAINESRWGEVRSFSP